MKGSPSWAWGTIFVVAGVALVLISVLVFPFWVIPGSSEAPIPASALMTSSELLLLKDTYEFPQTFYVETSAVSPMMLAVSDPQTEISTMTYKVGMQYQKSYLYRTELTEEEYVQLAGMKDIGIWELPEFVIPQLSGNLGNMDVATLSTGIDEISDLGYTGANAIIVIIDDFPPLPMFYEYFPVSENERILHYPENTYIDAKHGTMTASIAAHVAPDALLYFMDMRGDIYAHFNKMMTLAETYPNYNIISSNSYAYAADFIGYTDANFFLNRKIMECTRNEVLVLFAAGNWALGGCHTPEYMVDVGYDARASGYERNKQIGYPAVFPSVIAVAASNPDNDKILSYSSVGRGVGGFDKPDVAAPAHFEWGGSPYNGLAGGTSTSCPFMAGVLASVLTGKEMSIPRMIGTVHEFSMDRGKQGFDVEFGYGVVDAESYVENYELWEPPIVVDEGSFPIVLLSGIGLVGVGIFLRHKDEIEIEWK